MSSWKCHSTSNSTTALLFQQVRRQVGTISGAIPHPFARSDNDPYQYEKPLYTYFSVPNNGPQTSLSEPFFHGLVWWDNRDSNLVHPVFGSRLPRGHVIHSPHLAHHSLQLHHGKNGAHGGNR